jgi:Tol biopolymer transport system component/DNA-binding winged helix-turn-helix (wHTH) protein
MKAPASQPEVFFYEFGPFRLDLANRLLFCDEEVVHLTPKVFETLLILVRKSGQVLEKDELMSAIWPDSFVEEGSLTRSIATLRKALGEEHGEHRYIETMPRRGYRFVAKVHVATEDGFVPAVVASQNIVVTAADGVAPEPVTLPVEASSTSARNSIKRRRQSFILATTLLLAVSGFAFWLVGWLNREKAAEPFHTIRMTRLTMTGRARDVAISPDGKYVAYVMGDAGRQGLVVRQVAAESEAQIVPPAETRYRGLTFSRDGDYLYFVSRQKNEAELALYRIPVLGGAAQRLMGRVDSAVTFSPDGSQLAFVRESPTLGESALVIARADGSGERRQAVRKLPASFSVDGPAWSPDGKLIACAAVNFTGGLHYQMVAINVVDGSEQVIGAQRWLWMKRVAWLPDGSGLVVPARQPAAGLTNQIWRLSYPGGEARRVTNDLNDYHGLSLTADAATLVAVQVEELSTIWVAPRSNPGRAAQITQAPRRQDGYRGLAWTPDGRIVYSSNASGSKDLWRMNADGSRPERLTSHAGDNVSPAVSGDGRFIVFVSNRGGASRVWRMEMDGSRQQELTGGDLDLAPALSPDNRWIIYSSIKSGRRTLWRAPAGGGEASPLTDTVTEHPAISPDGQWIACLYREGADSPSSVAALPFAGGAPALFFDLPITPWPLVRWSPEGQALTYVDTRDEISNLWRQRLSGGAPARLTDFNSERIFAYAWSPDGKRLACARGAINRDVITISDFKR